MTWRNLEKYDISDTDVRLVLQKGLREISRFECKVGLLLTDGAWNHGGDPLPVAAMYDKRDIHCLLNSDS